MAGCDCGTCCNACGHTPGCSIYGPPPEPPRLDDPPKGSFLAHLVGIDGDA